MVQFDISLDLLARKKLIALSFVKVLKSHGTFNAYHIGFDPFNPINFAHLVIVHILDNTPNLFRHIREVVKPIGKYVKGRQGLGFENHYISTVVRTRKRAFKASAILTIGTIEHNIVYSFVGKK